MHWPSWSTGIELASVVNFRNARVRRMKFLVQIDALSHVYYTLYYSDSPVCTIHIRSLWQVKHSMLECIIGILSEFREVLVGGYVCGKERQGQASIDDT